MLMLQGVAILVPGAVVRGLVVSKAWSHEQGLPRRGGAKPWCWGESLDGWGCGGFCLDLLGALGGAVWVWCRPTRPSMLGLL